MRILAIDTCAKTAAAAVLTDGKPTAMFTLQTQAHSTTLLPMIESMLQLNGLTYDDIDAYAVACGPGSFTGVRIGVAAIKGLAFAKNTPCIGVSATEAMAENFRGIEGIIVPATDARRDMVYTALFRSKADGSLERLTEDEQVAIPDLLEALKRFDGERIYFGGDAYDRLTSDPQIPAGTAHTPTELRIQSAYGVARAALEKWNKTENKSVFSDVNLLPVYLKKSQAEREREERLAAE